LDGIIDTGWFCPAVGDDRTVLLEHSTPTRTPKRADLVTDPESISSLCHQRGLRSLPSCSFCLSFLNSQGMGILKRIQTLPAFALGVFFLYWSLPLAALMNKVKFLKIIGKRNDAYGW
jgi:hypothetical protein